MEGIYDVAIIGGGPAGTHAAKSCAEKGLSTILFEENEAIGEPVHCGECLSKLCEANYGLDIPVHAISKKVKGIRVIFPSGKDTFLDEDGYVLEKHLFEQYLASEAKKKGAEILLSAKVEGLRRAQDFWELKTKKGDFTSRILIDASGPYAFASTNLNLNPQRFETVIGIQYEMEEVTTSGYIDFYLDIDAFPHGYFWVIPKSGNRSNVGLVTNQKTKAKILNDAFIKKLGLEGKKIRKTFGGLIPASGPLPKTYGESVMLIGDAAGFTSPLFEGGTHLSIASGMYAAQVAHEAIQKKEKSAGFFSKYETLWKEKFPNYSVLLKGKDSLYKLSNQELDQLGDLFPTRVASMGAGEKLKVLAKLTLTHPNLYTKDVFSILGSFGASKAESFGW